MTHRALQRGRNRTVPPRRASETTRNRHRSRARSDALSVASSHAAVRSAILVAMHCGDPTHLCARCLDEVFASELDIVRSRGKAWANELAGSVPCIDWPTGSEGLAVVARLKVTDLGRDPRLVERLAHALLDAARAQWLSRTS